MASKRDSLEKKLTGLFRSDPEIERPGSILLFYHDLVTSHFISRYLNGKGFNVFVADSEASAKSFFVASNPDVILSMPGNDSFFEIIERIREPVRILYGTRSAYANPIIAIVDSERYDLEGAVVDFALARDLSDEEGMEGLLKKIKGSMDERLSLENDLMMYVSEKIKFIYRNKPDPEDIEGNRKYADEIRRLSGDLAKYMYYHLKYCIVLNEGSTKGVKLIRTAENNTFHLKEVSAEEWERLRCFNPKPFDQYFQPEPMIFWDVEPNKGISLFRSRIVPTQCYVLENVSKEKPERLRFLRARLLETNIKIMKRWRDDTSRPTKEDVVVFLDDYIRRTEESLLKPPQGPDCCLSFDSENALGFYKAMSSIFGMMKEGPLEILLDPDLWWVMIDGKLENWGVGDEGNNRPSADEILRYFANRKGEISTSNFYRMAVFDPEASRIGSILEDVIHNLEHPAQNFRIDQKAYWIKRFIQDLFPGKEAEAMLSYLSFAVFKCAIRKPYKIAVYIKNVQDAYEAAHITSRRRDELLFRYSVDFAHWKVVGMNYADALLRSYPFYGRDNFVDIALNHLSGSSILDAPLGISPELEAMRNAFYFSRHFVYSGKNPGVLLQANF